jgi:hypothetical protein
MLPPPAAGAKLVPHTLTKKITTQQQQKVALPVAGAKVHAKIGTKDSISKNVSSSEALTKASKFQGSLVPACEVEDDDDDSEISSNFFAFKTESELPSAVPLNISGTCLNMSDEELLSTDSNKAEFECELPSLPNSHRYGASVHDSGPDQYHREVDDSLIVSIVLLFFSNMAEDEKS